MRPVSRCVIECCRVNMFIPKIFWATGNNPVHFHRRNPVLRAGSESIPSACKACVIRPYPFLPLFEL
jgi:hypothetical protein